MSVDPQTLLSAPILSPSQARARRAYKKRMIEESQKAGLLPPLPPPLLPGIEPAGKLFDTEDLIRSFVTATTEAHAHMDASSHEGRLLRQALAEAFGALDETHEVERIHIERIQKATVFYVPPTERDPYTGGPPMLLKISIVFYRHPIGRRVFYINANDLAEIHPLTREPTFRASLLAEELVRLHFVQDGNEAKLGGS